MRISTLPQRIIAELAKGDPLPRLWVLYFGAGAISFGFLSIPSTGAAIVLIPMFLLSGALNLYGCLVCPKREGNTIFAGRKFVAAGLTLMILASWTRGVVLWGVSQQGAGNTVIASVVWLWITVGCVFLFIAVWTRGLQ